MMCYSADKGHHPHAHRAGSSQAQRQIAKGHGGKGVLLQVQYIQYGATNKSTMDWAPTVAGVRNRAAVL